ncbi:ATP-binding protein [Phaeospirillum tilakii]|uniref:AAA family ATPase n=1 Tax=Phaeospirillum tilakii TaxID=741673 RepID=A0ABW5C8W3_9PROT
MRLRRLDLTRYGKFTGASLDFGAAVAGAPDLHVVYGPNEAGKSTLFAAWLDLLYGIPPRSSYNFLHDYKAMQVGGVVELAGEARPFVRAKRAQNSLLDAAGQPLPDAAILAELGGIDRDSYRLMFSLDDDSLEQGGEAILAARGDLGQLLFSASSGLADLGQRLATLRETADRFHRPRARSGQLVEALADLDRLKAERAAIDTQAAAYAELVATVEREQARDADLATRRGAAQARREEIARLLRAGHLLARLGRVRADLAPLESLPEGPADPAALARDLEELRAAAIRLDAETATAEAARAELAEARATSPEDAAALALAGRCEDLAPLRARALTARQDLPERRQTLRELDLAIAGHLVRLGRAGEPDPARLALPAGLVERLRDLIEAWSGIDTACRAAAREAEEAEALCAAGPDPDDAEAAAGEAAALAALDAALRDWRGSDHAARAAGADRARAEAEAALADALAALLPWRGAADDLPALVGPDPARLQAWRHSGQAASAQIERRAAEVERLRDEAARLTARRAALAAGGGLATDGEAAALRAERDRAWAEHRARLDPATADHFAALLRQDDAAVARRFAHTAELAQLQQTELALAENRAALAQAEAALAAAREEGAEIERAAAAARAALSPLLPTDWGVPEIESWLARRERALAARQALRTAEAAAAQAHRDGARLEAALGAALQACGRPLAAGESPVLVAETVAAAAVERRQRRDEAIRRREARDLRRRAADRAEAERRAWETAWREACAGCWLGEGGVPAVATVRASLGVLADLAAACATRAALADRIVKMEQDQAAFAAGVAALAAELGLAAGDPAAAAELDRTIAARIRQAEAEATRRAELAARQETADRAAADLAARGEAHHRRAGALMAALGVASLDGVAARLEQITRRAALRLQAAELADEILDILRLPRIEDAEAACAEADPAALEQEQAGLAEEIARLEQEGREAYAARREAETALDRVGGDDRVAALEARRRTILLEIEAGARRALRLRAGALATEQALRLYRERHRGAMLARAAAALRLISRGAYADLATQPDKDGEVLVALAAEGGSKLAADLSKGTRFQLYLALRVAGYLEFARTRPAVPFVADDILETFDDFRAEETFRLFAQMAETGQVIYLTHHRHLCDIARAVCPGVRIHDL